MYELFEANPNQTELDNELLLDAVAGAQDVTIEFGTGDMPLFEAGGNNTFDSSHLYIGANVDPLQHEFLRKKVSEVQGHALLSKPKEGGGIEPLPLPDRVANTVFMANVFGEPNDENIMAHFRASDGKYHGHSDIESKRKTLLEAKRLLKDDGHLVILENNTPFNGGRYQKERYTAMIEELEKNGLSVVEALNARDPEWGEVVPHFAKPEQWWSYSSYLVIASKVN